MTYKFKPHDNLHLFYTVPLWLFAIVFNVLFLIVSIFDKFSLVFFYFDLFLFTLPIFIVFFGQRLFLFEKYVINDGYLIKYHRKKIVLKVKLTDIKIILVKKQTKIEEIKTFLLAFFGFYIHHMFDSSYVTTVSFVFDKHDVFSENKHSLLCTKTLKNDLYEECDEYVDIISFPKIKKIAKKLNIPLQIIN